MNENNSPALSIILPAYKEKENLAVLIPQIEIEFSEIPHEVIVVDDHSEDGTRELISELQKTFPHVSLLERPGLLGIGSALRDGYNRAQGEYILSSDADLSFSPSDMHALFNEIQTGKDLVLGYKISKDASEGTARAFTTLHGWIENHVVSPFSNWLIGLLSGVGLKNYNTNFRIIRASLWKRLRTVEDRHFFLFEMIVRAKQSGARIGEIPVTFSPRQFGESKVNFFRQAPAYFRKLVQIVFFDR